MKETTAGAVIRRVYEAFGKGDLPAILEHVSDQVDWELAGPPQLAYSGRRRNRREVEAFFGQVAQADDIHSFEPREFIEAGEHVTVLGWERTTARDTGVTFETEWAHVFAVRNGLIVRWRGFYNTGARSAAK
jgi:uncharacterized protein